MKILSLLPILCLVFFSANGQSKVPQAVKNSFLTKYPTAKKIKWEKESQNEYEVEFKLNGEEMEAAYKADGTWLETETEIKKKNLPASVKTAIATKYPGFKIDEAEKILKPDGSISYEVELEKANKEVEVLFSSNGAFLSEEVETDDDHNGDGEDDDEH